jgi:serine/threonine-protein kinase
MTNDASPLETRSDTEVSGTICHELQTITGLPRGSSSGPHGLERLDSCTPCSGAFELGAVIAKGGMGVVRTATQMALGRRVAVKTLPPGNKTQAAKLHLLREAWVVGRLEHPNIVPVHDLSVDDEGTPLLALKHIEGLPWSELIHNPGVVEARFGAADILEYNLRILLQLCNALSFAHARGIVHRDVKPANVMIGEFGEVYLVDWGLAVSFRDDPGGRLPLAGEAKGGAGTRSYMAPEMLDESASLTERTDVYLLGAILVEVLTGRPPHRHGDDPREVLRSILVSEPEFPPGVPSELAAIAKRAMSRVPADRYASTSELRERLEWYLRHRGSLSLSAEAALRVDELRAVLARGGSTNDLRDRVHHLFAEARFGFRHAIRTCQDNTAARAGLHQITEIVVTFELEHGTAEAAAAALAELDVPPPDLAMRVMAAIAGREAEKSRLAELEKLSADSNPSIGVRTRTIAALMVSLIWTVMPEVLAWLYRRHPEPPHWIPYVHTITMVLSASAVFWWGRKWLAKSALNRQLPATVFMMFAMQLTIELAGNLLGLSFSTLLVLHLFGWSCAAAAFSTLVDRRFGPTTLGAIACFLIACKWPGAVWHVASIAAAVLAVNAAVVGARKAA